jgi:signal peptidase II
MNEPLASDPADDILQAPQPNAEPAPGWRSEARYRGRFLLISLAILTLDQWSKWLVEANLSLHEAWRLIPGFLNFVHVRNTGVAFGMFPAHGDLRGTLMLASLGLLALSFVAWYFWTAPRSDRTLLCSLALVMGGAVGNLIDRLANGGVTDFIDFNFRGYHWHTFNIADSAITIGISLMILGALRGPGAAPEQQAEPSAIEATGAREPSPYG